MIESNRLDNNRPIQNRLDSETWIKLLCLTIIATLLLDHSQLDISINIFFYSNGQWLIEKGAQPYAFIFYDLPKYLLIIFAVYLLIGLILRLINNYRATTTPNNPTIKNTSLHASLFDFATKEIIYLLVCFIVIPFSITLLKNFTAVSCPSHLSIFGGSQPYLDIWDSIRANAHQKCFPAAHAGVGFSLYAFAFLPSLYQYRYRIFEIVTLVGWTLGLYKMMIGDHFFSHTLVSMSLSLTITYGLAYLFFKKLTANR